MSVQPNLTPKMRSILVDWLIELSEHFSFESSTLHLAVTMVDRVLASGRSLHDRFQLLGATCVWLACKVKEISPPKAKEIAYVSDHIYTVEQIKTMERRVCNALNFTFFEAPTPHHFLFEFMRASFAQESAAPIDSVFRDMAHYLLELGRLPYGPTGRKPSLLAAAVVYLTRVTLGIPRRAVARLPSSSSDRDAYWTPTLEYYTGYAKSDLFDTVLELHAYHMAAETSNLKAVFSKYKTKRFHRVALKTVVLREDLGF
ncbi:Cyclin_N-domain-containing protein [Fragilariopsis cylindrus CCMP1102]|uniref:Cyclin_N-domain-containing protein n=1 Tax=Fragilariopsis cylindrus CCMP1102 TaxID=635003 RepID=A0A1E7FB12_9STRA|nr:Cyclin_N-domain-containing protein [Fragilariopsis cylindrus CCMP1102]|eukprot:OEU15013.1 Cyclin_N-domain-containing protein [Fragilariopsis cylindrus CCMP1102]